MSGFAVTTYNPFCVGILSARKDSLEESFVAGNADVTLGVNSERYDNFLYPCGVLDSLAIDDLNVINTKLAEIADEGDGATFYAAPRSFGDGASAEGAVNTLYNGVVTNVGVATFLTFSASQTFNTGNRVAQDNTGAFGSILVSNTGTGVLLTGVGGTDPFNTTDICSVGIGTTFKATDTQIGVPASVALAGRGNINQDLITVSLYPNLEPPDPTAVNPWAGQNTATLGAGNTGLGIANTFTPNGGSFIGTVFAFDETADAGAAASITTLRDEIVDTLRPGITSFTETVNILKPIKIDFAVNVYTLSRVNVVNQVTMNALTTAITLLNDPKFGGPY